MAFALLRYLGVRRSDVVRIGRQHVKNGVLRFTAKKGEQLSPMRRQSRINGIAAVCAAVSVALQVMVA